MPTNPKGYYRNWRKVIIKKLGGKCTKCGSKKNLHIHHTKQTIKGVGRGSLVRLADWRKNIKYLILLCRKCHDNDHYKKLPKSDDKK